MTAAGEYRRGKLPPVAMCLLEGLHFTHKQYKYRLAAVITASTNVHCRHMHMT